MLGTPLTVMTTLPVVAPFGTGAVMLDALQLVGVVSVPLNLTVLVPWLDPKLVPVMVTEVPTYPEVGDRLPTLGFAPVTVKVGPLLAATPSVTTTLPVVAPLGTGALMVVVFQLVGVAVIPLKVRMLPACVAPKPVPEMVTEVCTGPEVGERLVMLGIDVKATLAETPPTVTVIGPGVAPLGTGATMLVALQLVGAAVAVSNTTVLEPCVGPKPEPEIVIGVPAIPELGETLVMTGGGT